MTIKKHSKSTPNVMAIIDNSLPPRFRDSMPSATPIMGEIQFKSTVVGTKRMLILIRYAKEIMRGKNAIDKAGIRKLKTKAMKGNFDIREAKYRLTESWLSSQSLMLVI